MDICAVKLFAICRFAAYVMDQGALRVSGSLTGSLGRVSACVNDQSRGSEFHRLVARCSLGGECSLEPMNI